MVIIEIYKWTVYPKRRALTLWRRERNLWNIICIRIFYNRNIYSFTVAFNCNRHEIMPSYWSKCCFRKCDFFTFLRVYRTPYTECLFRRTLSGYDAWARSIQVCTRLADVFLKIKLMCPPSPMVKASMYPITMLTN